MNTDAGFMGLHIQKDNPSNKMIALAGNSKVGKYIMRNALIHLNKHDSTALGIQNEFVYGTQNYILADFTGTDSLIAHSAKAQTARDFICFGGADAVIVACEAVLPEQSINLVLQTIEITSNVVVCVNSSEEARKKHIHIDSAKLEKYLGVPVAEINTRRRAGFALLMEKTILLINNKELQTYPPAIRYIRPIERAISILEPIVKEHIGNTQNSRLVTLKLIEEDTAFIAALKQHLNCDILPDTAIREKITEAQKYLADCGIWGDTLQENIASCIALMAEAICNDCISF